MQFIEERGSDNEQRVNLNLITLGTNFLLTLQYLCVLKKKVSEYDLSIFK